MIVKLLTEQHLEFLSLKGGCRGSSESTLVKMLCHSSNINTFNLPDTKSLQIQNTGHHLLLLVSHPNER